MRTRWELALAFALRDALRSGDVYIEESRHHVSFWNLVHGPERWERERAAAYVDLELPPEPAAALNRLRDELDRAVGQLADGLEAALAHALDRGAISAASVAHVLDQRARARKVAPSIPVVLPEDPRVRDLRVTPHALAQYDALAKESDDDDESFAR